MREENLEYNYLATKIIEKLKELEEELETKNRIIRRKEDELEEANSIIRIQEEKLIRFVKWETKMNNILF